MARADRGEHVAPSKVHGRAAREGANRHLARQRQDRARAAEGYTNLLPQLVADLGDIPLQRLGSAGVERWHGELPEVGHKI
jgi:hypothetical protein